MTTARARVGVVLSALLTLLGTGLILAPLASNASASPRHTPVGVCHATSSDTHPYEWIVVDSDSTRYRGHLMHRDEPNKRWKSAGTWNGIAHKAGDPKPDYIEGLDAGVSEEWCSSSTGHGTTPPTTQPPTTKPPTTSPPTTSPPSTTTAPPTTTTAPPGTTPPPTTTTAPPTTTTAPPTTTTAPPETEPGTVPGSTPAETKPGTVPATGPETTPGTSSMPPEAGRPPLAETGVPSGMLTIAGLVLIALGIATYVQSRPRGKHA
jgi:hypothetical protein